MGIKKENTAAENAIPKRDPYGPDNLMMYRTSLSLVERLVKKGLLTKADYRKSCSVLTKRYGLPAMSIYAEVV